MTNYFITCILSFGMIMGVNMAADNSNQPRISLGSTVTCVVAAPLCIGAVVGMAAASIYHSKESK